MRRPTRSSPRASPPPRNAAAAVVRSKPRGSADDAAATWDGPIPGAGRTRIIVAGAPPPTRTIERVETELGWEFIQIYGLTETAPLLTMNRTRAEWDDDSPAERAAKLGRAGAPALGITVQVDGQGEILARGNHVLKSYWDQPEATAEAIVDGWFHTGDLGVMHPDGYIELKDRSKDIIISGGENISSIEVENALYRHPDVLEAAVVARPDAKWGEHPCAFVALKPGASATAEDIIAFCRKEIASYKVPRTVVFGALPKTSTGKIQKFALREQARKMT